MDELDFLPKGYTRRRRGRRTRRWHQLVLAAFLLLVGVAWAAQARTEWRLRQRLADLQVQVENLHKQVPEHAPILTRVREAELREQTLRLLSHRLLVTPVLAEIVGRLPEHVTLSEVHITSDLPAGFAPPAADAPPDAVEERRREFVSTLEYQRRTGLLVSVTGYGPNELAISEYVAGLQDLGLFDEVHHEETPPHAVDEGVTLPTFKARLRVVHPARQLTDARPRPVATDAPVAGRPAGEPARRVAETPTRGNPQ